MEKQNLIDTNLLDKELKEIEELQNQVSKILYSKNPFVRFFFNKKAWRLHLEADKRLENLIHPYTINYKLK
jgi:hypothetical protein